MESREEREKQAEVGRNFDAMLRERVATGGLTPRAASFLESRGTEDDQEESEQE